MPGARLNEAPYPIDTRAKGWRFELDHERIRQSDTWALASPELRPWLLMLWMVAWEQTPCGTLPTEHALIAARIGMKPKAFVQWKEVLLRGWDEFEGRLYHATMTERVKAMLEKRTKDALRAANHRSKTGDSRGGHGGITSESRVTSTVVTVESDPSSTPSTKHQAPEGKHSEAKASGAGSAPDSADQVFGLGVALMTANGVTDRQARSTLGLLRKQHGDGAVIAALERCAIEKPLQPVSWLVAAMTPKTRHAGFEAKNYREGVAADGSL